MATASGREGTTGPAVAPCLVMVQWSASAHCSARAGTATGRPSPSGSVEEEELPWDGARGREAAGQVRAFLAARPPPSLEGEEERERNGESPWDGARGGRRVARPVNQSPPPWRVRKDERRRGRGGQ